MAPWAEYLSQSGHTQEYSFGLNESSASFQIITPCTYPQLNDTVRQILGWSQTNADNTLTRNLPARHPRFYWLWAQKVSSINLLSFTGKAPGGGGAAQYADYNYAIITIQFWSPPYEILPDGKPGGEYQRYITKQFQPTTEVLTLTGQFQFTPGNGAPLIQTASPMGLVITKMRIVMKWFQVPDDFVFSAGGSNNGGTPTGIINGIGKVNNAAFMGYPANTLLLEAPQFEPVNQPCEPTYCLLAGNPNAPNNNLISVPRAWNVTIPMMYFSPQYVQAVNPGHNSAPWKDGNWYSIQSVTAPNNPPYGSYDYTKIFKKAT